jgi:dihydrofolate reductase
MRKIICMMSMSLDGFISGPHGELDWHLVDEELHLHFNQVAASMSASLDGRVMYELMAEFWPTADQDPQSPPAIVEFAKIWREMPKIVYSRTLDHAGWNASVRHEIDVDELTRLKAQPGGDMGVSGAALAHEFKKLGLIDEYRVYVHPVLVGEGIPLFKPSDTKLDLHLVEQRPFTNGVVLLRYEVVRSA